MSVVIYRGEGESLETILVEGKRLQNHLALGYRLEIEPEEVQAVVTIGDEIEDETEMLRSMKILPTLDNVIVGALNVAV